MLHLRLERRCQLRPLESRRHRPRCIHRHLVPETDLLLRLRPRLRGKLPRVGVSTKGEGRERRYFYGTVWAVSVGQTVVLILWKTLPRTQEANFVKLIGYIVTLAFMAYLAAHGKLHRTKPILPGDIMVAD